MKKYILQFTKISKKKQNKLKKIITSNYDFNKLDDDSLKNITEKININPKIIISYRNQLLKQLNLNNHHIVKNNLNKLLNEYKTTNILELSKIYKLSPVSLIRIIIKKKYKINKSIKKIINELNIYDKKQLEIAEKNDIVAPLNQDEIQIKSELYENKIGKFLDKKNIKYKNQEDLINEQIKEIGYAYATPDFLLEDPIEINGTTIKWLEVKNFYGTDIKFMTKKIQKQINKYFNKWGIGCLVFRYGIYEDLKINNCLIIAF